MVSIVVPVYNAETVLQRSVPAVLAQHGADDVVWVDDGSTDESASVLETLTRSVARAKVVRLGHNRGRGAARNAGADAAQGDVIVFFDADVEPPPEAALQLDRALSGGVASVARFREVLDRPDDPYQRYLREVRRGPPLSTEPVSWRYFLSGACAIRRSAFESVGRFSESIDYGEDFALGCHLGIKHPKGLRVARTTVDLHDVGTIDTILPNLEAFGRTLAALEHVCPDALEIARVSPGVARLARAGFVPRLPGLARIVRTVPAPMQPRAVRLALGLSLLTGFGRA